mgnify:CR=1 FL=1
MAGHRFLGGAETVQQAAKGGEQGGDVSAGVSGEE